MAEAPDFSRRFGGVARLYGEAGLQRLQAAHVAVIGLGGVGSWVNRGIDPDVVQLTSDRHWTICCRK